MTLKLLFSAASTIGLHAPKTCDIVGTNIKQKSKLNNL